MKRIIILVLILVLVTTPACTEPSDWAKESVNELKEKGHIETSFFNRLKENITRKDFIYLAVRAYEVLNGAEITEYESFSFTDTDDVYARKAAKVGITSGIGNGEFGIDQLLTREQLAVFMVKVLEISDLTIEEGNNEFDDESDFSSWAINSIKKAKANGIVSGVGQNRFDSKGKATKEVSLIIVNNVLNTYQKDEVIHPENKEGYKSTDLEVCYDLKIDDFNSGYINITMKVINIKRDTLDIREFGRIHGPQGHVEDIKAFDKGGNELKVVDKGIWYRGWNTTGKQFSIDTKGSKEATVTYKVNKQVNLSDEPGYTNYEGYLGDDYGVFTAEQAIGLFLFCDDEHYINENIHLTIDVPAGYKVITPWYEEEGVYYPNTNFYDKYHEKYAVRTSDHFMLSTFAVGNYDLEAKQLDGTLTTVAMPKIWSDARKKLVSNNIIEMINYYNKLFGKSVLDQYLMVYTPDIDGVNRIWAGESVSSQGTNVLGDDYKLDMVAHQIFHRWNAFVLGWYEDIEIRSFFKEGTNRYFECKSMIELYDKLNYLTNDGINYIENMYKTYKEKHERNEIIAMKDTSDGDVDDNLAWNAYHTGALVWFALDMKLYEETNYTVNDIMKALDDYARKEGKVLSYDLLLKILKENTGKDYKPFLDQYVYDNKHLQLDKYFDDDDGDRIPNYVEIIRGTDPKVMESHPEIIELFAKTLYGIVVSNVEFHLVGSKDACDIFNKLYGNQVTISEGFGYPDWTYKLNEFRGKNKGYLVDVDGMYNNLPEEIRAKITKVEYDSIQKEQPAILSLDDSTLIMLVKK